MLIVKESGIYKNCKSENALKGKKRIIGKKGTPKQIIFDQGILNLSYNKTRQTYQNNWTILMSMITLSQKKS